MNERKFDLALMSLRRCEGLCENNKQALGVIYNNFACYYK